MTEERTSCPKLVPWTDMNTRIHTWTIGRATLPDIAVEGVSSCTGGLGAGVIGADVVGAGVVCTDIVVARSFSGRSGVPGATPAVAVVTCRDLVLLSACMSNMTMSFALCVCDV